jgi:multidrug resistance efflux pump
MPNLDDLRIDAPVPKPQRRRSQPWVPIVFILFLILVTAWLQRDWLVQTFLSKPAPAATQDTAQPDVNAVGNALPAAAGPPGSISAAGYLEVIPPGPVVVSALVEGQINEVLVTPGQPVEPGQVLARLDSSAFQQRATILLRQVELEQARLARLEAGSREEELDQAAAGVSRATAVNAQAVANYERSLQLFTQGVIARAELDAAKSQARQAAAEMSAAQAQLALIEAGTRPEDISIAEAGLRAAQAELQEVNWQISQCTLRAPAAGVVLEQFAQPGDWLAPGTDNPKSGALLSLFDPRQIQAWVDVNQRDSAVVTVGQQVELATDAFPNRPVQGIVSRIMPQANLQKNTVQVKISIVNPPADFKPELSVKVAFISSEAAIDQPAPTPEPTGGTEE